MTLRAFGRSVLFVALAGVTMLPMTGALQSSVYAGGTLSQQTLNCSNESAYRFLGSFSSPTVVVGNDSGGAPFQLDILDSYVVLQADLLRWAEPQDRDAIEDSGVVARYVIGSLQTARGTEAISGALYAFPDGTVAVRISGERTDTSARTSASLLFEFETVSGSEPSQLKASWGCWGEFGRWMAAAAAEELTYLAAAAACLSAPGSPQCLALTAAALTASGILSQRLQEYCDCMDG